MAIDIRRREFIFTLGGAAAAWPLAARAQQSGKLPTIGFLARQRLRLRANGLPPLFSGSANLLGSTVATLRLSIAGQRAAMSATQKCAAEFVRLKVDVIVTVATPATLAAKQATTVIPIVFAAASDPVGTGLVASLARPGGNITGLANQISDTGGKKLELLREIVPGLRRLAIMANVGNPASVLDMGEAAGNGSRARP